MKTKTQNQLAIENADLRARLEEAEETLRAIRTGEVDALIISGVDGEQIFTLKQAEDALAESEEKFRKLVERLPSVVYMNEVRGKNSTLYVSPQIATQLGYTQEEWLADPTLWSQNLHPEDRQEVMKKAAHAGRNKGPFDMEYRMITRDGRLVWIHDQAILVNDLAGQPKFRQGIMLDITTRKKTEEALHESEEHYRLLVEALPDGVVIHSQGCVVFANPATATLIGATSPAELIGKPVLEFVHPNYRERVLKRIQKSLSEGTPLPLMAEKFVRQDGTPMDVEVSAIPFSYAGKPAMLTVFNDITTRKRTEEALHESEVRYRSIFENSQDAILLTAPDGSILEVNPATSLMFGRTEEEITRIGRNGLMDLTDPRLVAALEERARTGKARSELSMLRADGSKFPADVTSTAFIDAQGQVRTSMIIRDITERKKAEQVLQESEKRFRALVENNSSAITMLDAQGIAIYDSPAAPGMLGYTPEDWIGQEVFALVHPDDLSEAQTIFTKLIQTPGARVANTFRVHHKSGSWLWIEMVTTNLLAEPGVNAIVLNYRDITERKQAETALRESNERFREVWETSSDALALSDSEGIVLTANPAYFHLYGYTPEQVIGSSFAIIFPKEHRVGAVEEYKLVFASQATLPTFESSITRANGEERIVETHVTFLKTSEQHIAMLSNIRDITERKQAEAALAESERHYRQIIETAGEGIWTIDEANRTTLVNQHLADMLGYTIEEMIGKAIDKFTDEEGKAIGAKSLENRRLGINEQLDFKYIKKDGSTVWALVETSTLLDRNHQYAGALAMLTDITRRKQIEAEIRQRLSELELLYKSSLAFNQLKNPKDIAEKIIELLAQEMNWHHTAIRLYNPENQLLELLAFNLPNLNSPEERSAAEERFKVVHRADQGLSGWVMKHGEALRANDLRNDTRYVESFPGLQSGLYVPIKIGERVIGAISIESERAEAFGESDERLAMTLATQAASAMDNALLLGDLKYSNIELALTYDATIEGWSRALDLRDKETEGHSQRVTELTLRLARAMGISEEDLVHVRRGALLHDIGKMGVPDSILLKPGPLTEEEWLVMKKHPIFAHELLAPIRYLRLALDLPYCHHEKWDGSGYPRGLKGIRIPLAARIFAIVDVWDALNSDRPYRPAWAREKVLEHIRALSGTHFDPHVVDIFMQIIDSI